MKAGVRQILGKRIVGVLVKQGPPDPREQVFLVFEDDTYYEFYSASIQGAGGVDPGGVDAALRYLASPDRWPTFAAFEDGAVQARLDVSIALGRIVVELRRSGLNESSLVATVKSAREKGLDWRSLYAQALTLRNVGSPLPPPIHEIEVQF